MKHFYSLALFCAAFCLAVLFSIQSLHAQTDDYERIDVAPGHRNPLIIHSSKEEAEALRAHWNAIGEELKTTENPAAGTYSKQGYRGYYLRWSPKNGFVYLYHYENIDILDYSYGKAEISGSKIIFTPEREFTGILTSSRGLPRITPRVWIPVRVNQGTKLIPEPQMSAFGDYVAGFGDYNSFNHPWCCEFALFFSKKDKTDISGVAVPDEYKKFIKTPIRASVKAVGKTYKPRDGYGVETAFSGSLWERASVTPVTINAGRKQGVKRDMLFRLVNQPEGQFLIITRVNLKTSRGEIVRQLNENGEENCYDDNLKDIICPKISTDIKITSSPILD